MKASVALDINDSTTMQKKDGVSELDEAKSTILSRRKTNDGKGDTEEVKAKQAALSLNKDRSPSVISDSSLESRETEWSLPVLLILA